MSEADKDGRLAEWLHDSLSFNSMPRIASVRDVAGVDHDHAEYVPGCFRCDLSRAETGG